MISRVSNRTRDRIVELTRTEDVGGVEVTFCPCRVLPETVLNLKTLVREIHDLWGQTLGAATFEKLLADPRHASFFAGDVRLVEVQEGRPEMVAVWLAVPPDYAERVKVQLVDSVEPYEFP